MIHAVILAATLTLEQRLARFKPVEMPFTFEPFNAREQRVIKELIAASRDLENIYWRQNSPEDIPIYKTATGPLKRLLWINGSRYDQVDENKPFIGTDPMPPGRALYARSLTRDQIESYVKAHPSEKKAIYDERTVVDANFKTTPYHVKYRQWLGPAAQHLRNAAESSDDKAFAEFLKMRAKALLDDDYY